MPGSRPSLILRRNLFAGFGGLLLLMLLLGASAISAMYRVESREEQIRASYVERNRAVDSLRSNIYLSGTRMREYLLEPVDQLAAEHRLQYQETRRQIEEELRTSEKGLTAQSREPFRQLQQELDGYFRSLAPALSWTPQDRHAKGYDFTQSVVMPQRTEVLAQADRVENMQERDLELSGGEVSRMTASLRIRLIVLLILTILVGGTLAVVSLWRLLHLESESGMRFEEIRRLSAELLSAQETERRRISRELHDEVGQMLSAISLSLASVRSSLRSGRTDEAFSYLQQVQDMAERNLATVRNIALLLRPTMLDDLGLVPALRWLAREASRTTGIVTDIDAESFVDDLPEDHRTCVYRVVQEALRNAARHSGARHIRIDLRQEPAGISAAVQDDGKGFDPREEKGLGMVGMEERALHLGGELRITSGRGRGTTVRLELPLTRQPEVQVQMSPLRTA